MVGVDQSIESLNLNEFDYVEEVKDTPNKQKNNVSNTKEQETKKDLIDIDGHTIILTIDRGASA